jgi:hypothetical protein
VQLLLALPGRAFAGASKVYGDGSFQPPPPPPPAATISLSGVPASKTSVRLAWTHTLSNPASFEVELQQPDGSFKTLAATAGSVRVFVVKALLWDWNFLQPIDSASLVEWPPPCPERRARCDPEVTATRQRWQGEEVMKKVVLFALLLATAAAAAAHAVTEPRWGATYLCYYDNYSGNASDPGYSTWHSRVPLSSNLIASKETFTTSYGTDTYKAAWAKPVDQANGSTLWEFTFNPYGPQCKKTFVYPGAYTITFNECTDGHSRTCYLW